METERKALKVRELRVGDFLTGSRSVLIGVGPADKTRRVKVRDRNGAERARLWRSDTTVTIEREA